MRRGRGRERERQREGDEEEENGMRNIKREHKVSSVPLIIGQELYKMIKDFLAAIQNQIDFSNY